MFHQADRTQMAELFAENGQLHELLELRYTEIAFLQGQVAERDATLRSLRTPVYDILAAVSSHIGNTTDLASKAKAENRDLLMEECEEAISADNGGAELAAVEKWVTETTKPSRTVPAPENRCQGICASGTQCSRSHCHASVFCKTHLKMESTKLNPSSPDSGGDEKAKAATKTANRVEREAVKATKAAAKLAERAAAQATKLAEREAAKAVKLAEKEAKAATKLAEKEAKAAAKLAEKEAKAAAREAAKAVKPKRPTPPFALWQSEAKTEIAAAVSADTTRDPYLTVAARLWKALPEETRLRYKEQSKTQRIESTAASALAELSATPWRHSRDPHLTKEEFLARIAAAYNPAV